VAKFIAVQLESCHANTDGDAWYLYVEGSLVDYVDEVGSEALSTEIEDLVEQVGAPLGIEVEDFEEVPTPLSKHTGLRRYYVGAAV
jgi:hypothetical protein